MSSHLSDDVLLEMAETGRPHPHIAQCPRCRRQIEDAREAMAQARAVEVLEPSPLFWEHLSSRVHDAVAREVSDGRQGAWTRFAQIAWRPAALSTFAVILLAAVLWGVGPVLREPTPQPAVHQQAGVQPVATSPTPADSRPAVDWLALSTDASWSVITEVTAGLGIDTATEAGIVVQPGASDRAIAQLSPSEQQALVRLLQTDLENP